MSLYFIKTIPGSTSYFTEKKHVFAAPIIADALVFVPKTFQDHPIMRVELYGFTAYSDYPKYGKNPGIILVQVGVIVQP